MRKALLRDRSCFCPLFIIYMYDLPFTASRKYAYADDLALLHFSENWKDLEGTLSEDMATLSAYHGNGSLSLSRGQRGLKVYANGKLLPFCPVSACLRVKLGRSLQFRHHLATFRIQLATRVTLLRQLAGTEWGTGTTTLRTAVLSWFILQLSTAHQFGVAVHTPVSSTVF